MPGFPFPRGAISVLVAYALVAPVAALPARAESPPVVALHANKKHKPGKVTFVDPDTLAVRGEATVQGAPWPLRFDPSGRTLFVFGAPKPGPAALQSKKSWTLSSVDAASFTSKLIGEAGRSPDRCFTDGPATRLYVLGGKPGDKVTPITAFDLGAGKPRGVIANVEHLVSAALSADGRLLLVLCEGKKHNRPEGPAGNLHILDATTGVEITRRDVGRGASSVAVDPARGLAYMLGAADEDGSGRVTVLRGADVVAQFALPGAATALAHGPGEATYVLAHGAVAVLAADGLAVARSWRVDFSPSDLIVDAPRGRVFAGARSGSQIAELDLASSEVLAERATGRGGVKVGQDLGRALVGVFAVGATLFTGIPVVPLGLFASSPVSMTLGADGAMLYVLNPYTNDVTLFSPDKRDVVGFVPTGSGARRIVRAADDPNFGVESWAHLGRLNTAMNQIDRTLDLSTSLLGRKPVAYDQRRGRAWILETNKIRVFDLRTGESAGAVDLGSPAFGLWTDETPVAQPASSAPR